MDCENCGRTNDENARYCAACGVELGAVGAASASGGGTIRTRGLGEFLDEAFRVYRANFLPFIVIAAIPQVAFVLSSIFQASENGAAQGFSFLLTLAGVVLSVIAVGSLIFGVTRHYTRGSVDVMDCLSHAFQVGIFLIAQAIIFTIVVGALLVAGAATLALGILALFADGGGPGDTVGGALILIGGLLTLVGIVIAVWLSVRWFCAVHAVVIEGKGPIAGLGRSWNLVTGSWWRVFGIGLVFAIIATVAIMVIAIPVGIIGAIAGAIAAGEQGGTVVGAIAGALATIVVTPFAYIAGTLIYFDLRVRKEGFDLDVLADETSRV